MRTARRNAAVSVDREGRTPAQEELVSAAALWEEIVQGRWTIVDRFQADGRRYLIARRAPGGAAADRLSARAYQVLAQAALGRSNKHIAFELALPISTVATDLTRAMRKLGIRSRVELVGMWPGDKTQ